MVVCKSVYCAGLQAEQGMFRSLMSQPIPASSTGESQVVSAQHRYGGSAVLGYCTWEGGNLKPAALAHPDPSHAARMTSIYLLGTHCQNTRSRMQLPFATDGWRPQID